jgi:hypothetical protein
LRNTCVGVCVHARSRVCWCLRFCLGGVRELLHRKGSTGRGHGAGQLPQSHYQVSPASSLSLSLTLHPSPSVSPSHSLPSPPDKLAQIRRRMFEKLYLLSCLELAGLLCNQAIVHVIYESTATFEGKPNHRNNRSEESILTYPRCQFEATTGKPRLC